MGCVYTNYFVLRWGSVHVVFLRTTGIGMWEFVEFFEYEMSTPVGGLFMRPFCCSVLHCKPSHAVFW
jgi:hypothetical protein